MAGTVQRDVLLIIRAKETAARAIDAASDALRTLFETQQDVAGGSQQTGKRLVELIENIKKVEQAYGTIDKAAAKADAAFTRQQQKLAGTRAELEAITKQIEGAARAIEKVQKDIVEARSGGTVRNSKGDALDYSTLVEQLKQAKVALAPLQAQQERLTASIKLQESALGGVKSSLQQLGSAANATEAALVQAGGNASRAMLEARLATEKATAALREQAKVARDEVQARGAQSRINSVLGVREPVTGSARQSAAVFEEHLRTAQAIGKSAMEVGAAEASMAAAIGRAAREVSTAEAQMAQKAALLKERLDPLTAVQQRLNRELKEARDLYRSGHISAQELALAERVLAQNAKQAADALERQGRGERGAAGLFGLKPYEMTNLGYQINDVFTQMASGTSVTQTMAQQGGQMLQLFPKLGSTITAALGNPVIIAAAATFGLLAMSIKKMIDEGVRIRTLSGVLLAMGDGARYNAKALSDTALNLDLFGMSAGDALAVVRRFLREGLNPALIEDFGKSAQNVSRVLGVEVKAAAEQIAEGFSGSYDALVRLDDSLNILTVSEREHIRMLYDSGRATEARAEAAKIFIARMDEAARKGNSTWYKATRSLEVIWNSLLKTISNTAIVQTAVGYLGAVADLLNKIGDLTQDPSTAGNGAAGNPTIQPRLDTSKIDAEIKELHKRITSLRKADRTLFSPDENDRYEASLRRLEARLVQLNRERKEFIARGGMAAGDPVDLQGNPAQKRLAEIRAEEAISLRVLTLEQQLDEVRRRGNSARAAAIAGEIEYQRVLRQSHDTVKAESARRLAEQQENNRTVSQQVQTGQALLRTANKYEGYNENNRNQRAVLMEMFRQAGITIDPAKLAWCAAFINAVLVANGLPTAKGANGRATTRAADFKSYGAGVGLADARPGDIVVLRPQARGMSGHVGLFSGFDEKGDVRLTAGNQSGSKKVSTQTFGRGEVVAVRRPGLADQDAAFLAQADIQRLERQQTFNATLAEEADRRSRSVSQAKALLSLSGEAYLAEQRRQSIDNAVWNAEQQARRQNLEVTKEQRAEIERTAAAEWDALNAREKATRPVEELSRQRDALLESITAARRAGEDVIGDALEKDLASVDDALKQAIVSASKFWSELGTPEAAEALLSLGNLRDSMRRTIGEMQQARVDMIQEERQAVLGRITSAREAGDAALATGLEQRLSDIDRQLEQAIDSAVAFHKAFDSPESRTARTNLAALRDDIAKTKDQLQLDRMNGELGQFQAQRSELQEMIAFYRSIGEMDTADALREDLRGLDGELLKVIDSLEKFWSQSSRPEAQATLLSLQNLRNQILATQNEFRIAAGDIQQAFAGSMVNAVSQWAEALAQGRNAIRATWDAARQFAADFLRQLAMMLLQAMALKLAMKIGFSKVSNGMNSLLNVAPLMVASSQLSGAGDKVIAGGVAIAASAAALMAAASMLLAANASGGAGGGGGGGGSIWGGIGGALSAVMHTGGVVGSDGPSRSVWPGVFDGATRYHTGGVIGLRPREIPIIAERGEEMLTRDDPRHILNGGGQGGPAGGGDITVRNVNVFDSADMLSAALSTRVGERVLFNFVRRNGRAIEAAMKGG